MRHVQQHLHLQRSRRVLIGASLCRLERLERSPAVPRETGKLPRSDGLPDPSYSRRPCKQATRVLGREQARLLRALSGVSPHFEIVTLEVHRASVTSHTLLVCDKGIVSRAKLQSQLVAHFAWCRHSHN